MMMMIKEPLLPQQQPPFPSSLLICLYVGHFLARWGARMWEFSVGLYMIDVWPDSLLLAALYGVVESASTVMFGPLIGQWVDKLPYVKVIQIWLLTQNLSFIVAGGSVIALLVYSDLTFTNFMAFVSLMLVINLSGALGMLSTVAGTILIEREWVVVISEGHAPEYLTQMNSVIRRIDLICKLFAPVVTGFIISFVSLKASALALSIWNTLSVCLQYWLLMSVYNGIPSLSERNQKRVTRHSPMPEESPSTSQEQRSSLSNTENGSELSKTNGKWTISKWFSKSPYLSAWRVYLQQDVVLPGVALALLYFTVLSFGTLMTATLEWEGIPAYVIGIARGVSATIGIGATFLYPILQSRISTLRTGIWSIWSQWTCLLVCIASIWVQNNLVSAYMLMGGVAASRLGLWMFDLSVVQQMQDRVPESDRIVVGGVQNSIQSVLDLMTYVMGIIISNPQDRVSKRQIGIGHRVGELYILDSLHVPLEVSSTALSSFCSNNKSSLFYIWYSRLCHLLSDRLRMLVQSAHLGNFSIDDISECRGCKLAKMSALLFNKSSYISSSPFQLVYTNIWGPSPIVTKGGSQYYVSFVDDYSWFTWVYLMTRKSNFYKIYSNFHSIICTQFSTTIKVLRSDLGVEYYLSEFEEFLATHGTIH